MNCLVVGTPAGTTARVARAFLAASPDDPLTVLSDDTPGMLRLLDEPGLGACECLWADAATPATVDDALVHRRMLHGRPDVVVLVVDHDPAGGGSAWSLGKLLLQRPSSTSLVLTGLAATAAAPHVDAVLHALADAGVEHRAAVPPHVVVPGDDPAAILRAAGDLLRSVLVPTGLATPLLAGHCAH